MIRAMTTDDVKAVLAVECASFTTPWTEGMFIDELTSNPRAHYLVIEDENGIFGYAGFWQILDEGHITNVAIHPRERRKGYAKVLISAVFDCAKKMRIQHMTLEVRVSNTGACELYKSFGFKSSAVRKKYYTDNGEDALIMWMTFENKEDA